MSKTPSIAVLGAGITGVTTAYQLLKRGYDVTLIDAQRYPAMMTSYANGGQLSASNAEVWTHWATILHGIQWMLKKDAPLSLSLMPSWHKYSWLLEFLANTPNYRKNTIESARLAIQAREAFASMAQDAGLEFDLEQRGILHFYQDKAGFKHAQAVTSMLSQAGLERQELTGAEVKDIEPSLTGDFYGGFYTQSDSTGDIHKYSAGLAQSFKAQGGKLALGRKVAKLNAGEQVQVRFDDGELQSFDKIVVCAGVASKQFASQLGDRVNIYPVKGYSITAHLETEADQEAAPWVSLLDDKAKIVTSRLGKDRFRVAGTAEFRGYNLDIRADRVRPLVDWCQRLFPGMSTETVTPWAGLRPMMPSMMPRVGKGKRANVYYNTGHGHLGWTLSAATAEMIADVVVRDKESQSAQTSAPSRAPNWRPGLA